MSFDEFMIVIGVIVSSIAGILIPLIISIVKLNVTLGQLNSLIALLTKDVDYIKKDASATVEQVAQNTADIREMQFNCIRNHTVHESGD